MSSVILSGDSSGTITLDAPAVAGSNIITFPAATGTVELLNRATAVTASGTSVDFTGIPSWAKRITVMMNGVSTNGTSNYLIQLGDAGGVETTGYVSYSAIMGTSSVSAGANYTAGLGLSVALGAAFVSGQVIISLLSGNVWTASGMLARSDSPIGVVAAGSKTLSDPLTQVRITTVNGTDTFDAGSINVMWEG